MKAIRITLVLVAGLCSFALLLTASGQKQDAVQTNGAVPSDLSVPKEMKIIDVSLTAEEIALARSLHAAPPWGSPGKYAPGPERERVERKMLLWMEERRKTVRQEMEKRSPLPPEVAARKKAWEKATRIDEVEPGSGRKAVPYVLDEDLPASERKRFHQDLLRIHQLEQDRLAKDGPSKTLVSIVGERPQEQLRNIYNLIVESSIEAPPHVKARGFGTTEHRVAYVRGELEKIGVELTDEQIKRLIAVKSAQQLWTKD